MEDARLEPLRVCRTCGLQAFTTKDLEKFVKSPPSNALYGRQNYCKKCRNKSRQKPKPPYLRKCKICGFQAFTTEDLSKFIKDQTSQYGRRNHCKKCWSEATKTPKPSYLRKCRGCGLEANTEADLEHFVRNRSSTYGYLNSCSKCHREDSKQRIQRTADFIRIFRERSPDGIISCYFCGDEVTKLRGLDGDSLYIHSLDKNHENWDPPNKVPTHNRCHRIYHMSGARRDERGRFKSE